jgi:ABC-type glycerol-3-phosphate transport system substrate-binding protein
MRIEKKSYLIILVIFLIYSFSGCDKQVVNEVENSDYIGGTITIWNASTDQKLMEETIKRFQAKNGRINVEMEFINSKLFSEKLLQAEAAKGGTPDIMVLPEGINFYLNKYDNRAVDLTSEFSSYKDKFIKNKIQQYMIDGKLLGIPWNVIPSTILYRKDYFKEAGIKPEDIKTWDDFIEISKQINKVFNGRLKTMILAEEDKNYLYRQLCNQLGIGCIGKNDKLSTTKDNETKIINLLKNLNETGAVYSVPSSSEYMEQIKSGAVATVFVPSTFINKLIEENPEQKGLWGIMNVPAFEPGGKNAVALDYSTFVISKSTDNFKGAVDFIKFSIQDPKLGQYSIVDRGIYPLYADFYNDALLDKEIEFFNEEKIWRLLAELVKEAPETRVIRE